MSDRTTNTMRAVVRSADGVEVRDDVPIPVARLGELVLKVTAASICTTDLKIADGRFPVEPGLVMGHEFVGTVHQLGDGVDHLKVGQRAFVHTDTPCGQCDDCLANWNGQGCSYGGSINGFHFGVTRNGGHAEYVAVPFASANVVEIPDEVADLDALMMCDMGSTGVGAIEVGEVGLGDIVIVVGLGPVGLAAVQAARLRGAALVVGIDLEEYRLTMAREMGADLGVNPTEDPLSVISTLTNGRMADVVVEAVGTQTTFDLALSLTRPGGTLSSVGNHGLTGQITVSMTQTGLMGGVGNKRIITMSCPGGRDRARRLLALARTERLTLGRLVTHEFAMHEALQAYDFFQTKPEPLFKVALVN